jgi:hypothetical protein
MNQKQNRVMKSVLFRRPLTLLLTFLLCPFAGCILPYIQTTQRSPEITGRVLDPHTLAPVAGARVCLHQHPSTSCLSDNSGEFRLKETRNIHLFVVAPEGRWPQGAYYWPHVTVSHPGYISRNVYSDYPHIGGVALEPAR